MRLVLAACVLVVAVEAAPKPKPAGPKLPDFCERHPAYTFKHLPNLSCKDIPNALGKWLCCNRICFCEKACETADKLASKVPTPFNVNAKKCCDLACKPLVTSNGCSCPQSLLPPKPTPQPCPHAPPVCSLV